MKRLKILLVLLMISRLAYSSTPDPVKFGNAVYVDLSVGEPFKYNGKTIEVLEIEKHRSLVKAGGEQAWLEVARRSLPAQLGGLRIFVSDQINVKILTTDNPKHGLLQKDVVLCISDPAEPLLDPSKFVFPISKRDGYDWKMEENSHMFAYLGEAKWLKEGYYRSHEGIDLNMHEARGKEIHPLVAVESGTVVLVAGSTVTKSYDGCIIIKSDSQKDIYYIYKHTNPVTHNVKEGQKVKKGSLLSYIWGDNVWGHLHFAVVHRADTPSYGDRYNNLLNIFPQMYQLHFGNLEPVKKVRTEGNFTFGYKKEMSKNFKRIDEFNELTGYGWILGNKCPAQKVEFGELESGGNARLKKTLHAGTEAECNTGQSYYDFEVVTENGLYLVSAAVGDTFEPSGQKVYFEGTEAGVFEIQKAGYVSTGDHKVQVKDNRLTVRLEFTDDEKVAGINTLNFKKISK